MDSKAAPKEGTLARLALEYGTTFTYVLPDDVVCPGASVDLDGDGGSAAQRDGRPRYFAPENVAAVTGGKVMQLFGPGHCVKAALGIMAGMPTNAISQSIALGAFAAGHFTQKDMEDHVSKAKVMVMSAKPVYFCLCARKGSDRGASTYS